MKIWLLTNTPSPYQLEFLGAIQRSGRCALDVRFMRGQHRGEPPSPYLEKQVRYQVLTGCGPRVWSDAFRFHPRAAREVLTGNYDLYVLSGQYTSVTFVVCARLLARRRKAWVAWLERPWPEDYRPAWTASVSARVRLAARLRRRLLPWLLRPARRVWGIGSAAVEAYRALGLPQDRVISLPYHCDVERFARVTPEAVARVRTRHGLEERFVFLFSGALVPRKGADLLLSSFVRIAPEFPTSALLLLGEGPLRPDLERRIPEALRERIRFAGHVAYGDLPAHYDAADVFVLPSRHDGWAVVVNEACAAGLPVIATRAVGAAWDLVRDGENGFVVDRDDAAGLAEKMAFFAREPARARRWGARSREIAQAFSLEAGVARFCELARAASTPAI